MHRIFRFAKPAVLGLVLAAGSLTAAAGALSTSAAMAASAPELHALSQGGSARVWGFGFTPSGTERVQLIGSHSQVLATRFITDYDNGQLPWTQIPTSYTGTVTVQASRYSCVGAPRIHLCRYWTEASTQVTVFPAPHIDSIYSERDSVVLWASGFTPGTTVYFEAFDAHKHLLDIEHETADNSFTYLRGNVEGIWLHTGSYSGRVYVHAIASPHNSNWVSATVNPN